MQMPKKLMLRVLRLKKQQLLNLQMIQMKNHTLLAAEHSISSIENLLKRAKLNYLRNLSGRKSKITEDKTAEKKDAENNINKDEIDNNKLEKKNEEQKKEKEKNEKSTKESEKKN